MCVCSPAMCNYTVQRKTAAVIATYSVSTPCLWRRIPGDIKWKACRCLRHKPHWQPSFYYCFMSGQHYFGLSLNQPYVTRCNPFKTDRNISVLTDFFLTGENIIAFRITRWEREDFNTVWPVWMKPGVDSYGGLTLGSFLGPEWLRWDSPAASL